MVRLYCSTGTQTHLYRPATTSLPPTISLKVCHSDSSISLAYSLASSDSRPPSNNPCTTSTNFFCTCTRAGGNSAAFPPLPLGFALRSRFVAARRTLGAEGERIEAEDDAEEEDDSASKAEPASSPSSSWSSSSTSTSELTASTFGRLVFYQIVVLFQREARNFEDHTMFSMDGELTLAVNDFRLVPRLRSTSGGVGGEGKFLMS